MMLRAFSFARASEHVVCVCAMVCVLLGDRGPSVFRGVAQGAQSDMRVGPRARSSFCVWAG